MKGLRVRYPGGDWVLKGLDLEVGKGEVALIVGGAGSGKTTFVRAITSVASQLYHADVEGVIEIGGVKLTDKSWEYVKDRVKVVPQNPRAALVYPVVYEDLMSYAHQVYRSKFLAEKAISNVSKVFKISHLLDRHVDQLSGGELRRVSIAKSMISSPDIVVLDEPLMWLDDNGVREVRNAIEILKLYDVAVVVLEHRFKRLLDLADKVLLLKNGVLSQVDDVNTSEDTAGVGVIPEKPAFGERDVLLELRDVSLHVGSLSLNRLNLTVGRGDKVVVYGLNGSGKTTLFKLIAGVLRPEKGRVVRRAETLYLPQIPYLYFTEGSLSEEVKAVGAGHASLGLHLVRALSQDRSPFTLSWGEAVRFIVELSLNSRHELLLLDEPFSGLTYQDREEIGRRLAETSKTILVAASSTEHLVYLKGFRLVELRDGTLTEKGFVG
ncbi:ABC transporter related protein [Thermogladius calderae 1633]|uniref:ABC transporter related protein n=1 Tax=Thermogladius calderae (strain DSM 22663 / VKM B-2946 / 1633) TaxID=1184251 RepID=I3TEM9_THEC1|nr:ABC transporter related protein [Thermogladius calderae 1633]